MLARCRSATPDGRRRGASSCASLSTAAVASATDGHASVEPMRRGLGPGGGECLRLLDVRAHRVCDGSWIVEGHEPAGTGGEHVLCIPVRRRDDAAAGRDRECERAGGCLLLAAVRGHEHVGRREQVTEVVDREEAVVELDVVIEPELEHASLKHQPVPLAFPARDVGMRSPGDHVHDVGMASEDRGQRLDGGLQALARRDQPEGGELERVACRPGRCAGGDARRGSVRHDAHLARGAGTTFDEKPLRRLGHHDHELRLRAQLRQHLCLVTRRLREHRVQRHDERLRELARERQHVLAVATSEDAELVLEEHDVDVEPPEHPGRADVVAADGLRDRREKAAPLWARRLVHDRDEIDAVDVGDAEKRPPDVGGEGPDPARAGRVCGDDCRPHALVLRLLQPRADRCSVALRLAAGTAQQVEDAPQRLPHDVLPFGDSPNTACGGLVWESEHGDAPAKSTGGLAQPWTSSPGHVSESR